MARKLSRFCRATVLAAMLALALAGFGPPAWAEPAPWPPFILPAPHYKPAPQPAPQPPQEAYRGCDGSEPLAGGIFGAALGGLLASVLGEHHGKTDPGATVFGMIIGALLGATFAASNCDH